MLYLQPLLLHVAPFLLIHTLLLLVEQLLHDKRWRQEGVQEVRGRSNFFKNELAVGEG
jgi:hypothetical protein